MSDNTPSSPSLLAFLQSGTGRRLLVVAISFLVVTLNKRLNLDLDVNALIADVTLALGYVAQSAMKESAVAHADAKVEAAKAVQPVTPPVITPTPPAAS